MVAALLSWNGCGGEAPGGPSTTSTTSPGGASASSAPPAPSLDPRLTGGPGVRVHPRALVSAPDRAGIARVWQDLLAAMAAQDEAAIVKLGHGCKAGPRAFWSSLPPDLTPPPSIPSATRSRPGFARAWRSRRDRLPEMSSLWAAGGITLDEITADAAWGSIGPAMPAMTGVAFERDQGGAWSVCQMRPGD